MYAVLNFHWSPGQFVGLSRKERAFVIACIDERVTAEKEEMARARAR